MLTNTVSPWTTTTIILVLERAPSSVTKGPGKRGLLLVAFLITVFLCVIYNLQLGKFKVHIKAIGALAKGKGYILRIASHPETNFTANKVFEKRRKIMLELCKENGLKWRGAGSLQSLVISKRQGLAYCPVPKIASTFWSNLLLENSPGDDPTRYHDKLDRFGSNKSALNLKNLDFDVGHWYLKHYKSFIFVRDPYSRLLAAYIDKFFTPNPLYWSLGKTIIKNLRKNPDEKALACGQNVQFPEFIKYVISNVKSEHSDQHWKPIYKRCSPCQLEFDIIGKLENIKVEGDFIIKNYFNRSAFTDMESESAKSRLEMNVDNFYRFFPTSVRHCMNFNSALKRLLKKLQIRGLIDKTIQLPREWNTLFSVSHPEVKKFILDSHEMTSKEKAVLNRHEALVEAFSTVPMEDLYTLRELYYPDFKLFGYDPSPDFIFKLDRTKNYSSYFLV